jgi:hypothetical protein
MLTKIICLVLLIAVILIVGTSSVSADTSMSSMTDCHNDTCEEATNIPLCCMNAACLVAYNIDVNLALTDGRFSYNKCPISQPASLADPALVSNSIKPFDTGPGQDTSQMSAACYRCRDCLAQEEPPLY